MLCFQSRRALHKLLRACHGLWLNHAD
jgi:hypothetical protein